MDMIKAYLTRNPCYVSNVKKADSRYTTFQQRGPLGLMLHSVGCAQPDASVFIGLWNKPTFYDSCVHGVIDANSGTVFQTLPWNYRGWHAGGSANNTHVGVEMCESAHIRYLKPGEAGYAPAKFEVLDLNAAQEDCRRTYYAAVELFSMLCMDYHLDPLTAICSHNEGGKAGIASGHTDPEHYWTQLKMAYTMDGFRAAVLACMKGECYMDLSDLDKRIDEKLDQRVGKMIEEIQDVPFANMKAEVRELLDCEAINGGTSYKDNPNDINLPLNDLRVLVMAKRYVDQKANGGG